ncbi:MAG TPA: ABC transporter ATP-binding protein [Rectinemataceae bacterium]|nr:ABC transporter ATP-binding protein [Rectinemataceae bacterium]
MKMEAEANADYAIETRALCKSYGQVRALRGIDLKVKRREIYGFLGRNGAGKTTTIRILLGLVRPDEGEARILGSTLKESRRELLSQIGYFVETATAYPNVSVRENLEIQRRLQGASPASVEESIDRLGLKEYADRRAGTLSLGNKQRLSIARALLHKPRLLILDEPVNGLDPAGIVEIRELLRRLVRDEGITIFMSSHNLAEVDRLADRIGIVHEGLLVEELDAEELRRKTIRSFEIGVDDPLRAEVILRDELGYRIIGRSEGGLLRVAKEGLDPAQAARALVGAGIGLTRLAAVGEGLEDFFMRLTGGEK